MALEPLASQQQVAAFGPEGLLVPIIQVAFHNDLWWSIPTNISGQLYENHCMGRGALYMCDSGPGPNMRWYKIDFENMVQTNITSNRQRSVRIVWMRPGDISALPREASATILTSATEHGHPNS